MDTKISPPSVPVSHTDESPLAEAQLITMVMIITVIMKEGFIMCTVWVMMCYYGGKREAEKQKVTDLSHVWRKREKFNST